MSTSATPPSIDPPDFIDSLARRCNIKNPQVDAPYIQDGEWIVPFKFASRQSLTVDLSSIPATTPIRLLCQDQAAQHARFKKSITLEGAPKGATVALQGNAIGTITIATNGAIALSDIQQATISIDKYNCDLHLRCGRYTLASSEAVTGSVSLHDGATISTQTHLRQLDIYADCSIDANRGSRIDTIELHSESATISILNDLHSVGRLIGTADEKPNDVCFEKSPEPSRGNPATVKVDDVANVHVSPPHESQLNFTAGEAVTDVRLSGRVLLTIGQNAEVDRVYADSSEVTLFSSSPNIREVSGTWSIGDAREANIQGSRHGFLIESISKRHPKTQDDPFNKSIITNFSLNSNKNGRRVLAALSDAYHLIPSTSGLPGSQFKYRLPQQLLRMILPSSLSNVPKDAEFVDELARVSREKGSPGAVRTRIAWCSYRLRHLNSKSAWERSSLMFYRALGYGERPTPAFLTWIFIASLAAFFFKHFDSNEASFGTILLNQALSPLGALTRTGNPTAEWFEHVVRAVVAIPLITGAIATRNYVKQGR